MYDPSIESNFSVEQIVNDKIVDGKLLYFVKWKGFPTSQNSWEPEDHLKNAPDHIQQWKQKKKKLQRIDKICKRKKIEEESFDGKKYLKKNIDHNILSNQKRQIPRRKNKQLSKPSKDPDEVSTSKDVDSKSCNSETTSYRGKGLQKKQIKQKDPIQSILQSIKKLKEKNSQKPKLDNQKNSLPSEVKPADESNHSSTNIKEKKKKNSKKQLATKKSDKKINTQEKLAQQKLPVKINKNQTKNQQKSKPQKNSLKRVPEKKKQLSKDPIEKEKQNPQQQSKMFSISKKELMARYQQGNAPIQSNSSVQSQVVQQSSQVPQPTTQRISPTVLQKFPQKVSRQIPQQISKELLQPATVTQHFPLQMEANHPNQISHQYQPIHPQYPNPFPAYYHQVPQYQVRQPYHMPSYSQSMHQKPFVTQFSNLSRSNQFLNSPYFANTENPKKATLQESINAIRVMPNNLKNTYKPKSREFPFNKSHEYQEKSLDAINTNKSKEFGENILPKNPQVTEKSKQKSKEFRPQIYDQVERQKRERSREYEQARRKREKRDKKHKSKHDKHKKSQKKDRKHKKSRRHSSSSSSQRHKKSKKDKKDSSSSSSGSKRSQSPQFSSQSDQSVSPNAKNRPQTNLYHSYDKLDQRMLPKEKQLSSYLSPTKQKRGKSHDKKSKKEKHRKKSSSNSNSYESKQRSGGKWHQQNSIIEIWESSQNNSSSLAVIDEQEFTDRVKKRVALNENYQHKWTYGKKCQQHQKTHEDHRDNTPTIDPVKAAQSLMSYLYYHPSKWWQKDMNSLIKEMRKQVRKSMLLENNHKSISHNKQSNESSLDKSSDWEFPLENNHQNVKIQYPFSQKKNHKADSRIKFQNVQSKITQQLLSTSTNTTVSQSQSKKSDTQCFNLLIDDILDWFRDLYPNDEITSQIRKQIERMVQKMVDEDLGDDMVEKWMEDYGRRKNQQKDNFHNSVETIETTESSQGGFLKTIDKQKGNNIIDQNGSGLDYIAAYFKPKDKKHYQKTSIVKLQQYDAHNVGDKPIFQSPIFTEKINQATVKTQPTPTLHSTNHHQQIQQQKHSAPDTKQISTSSRQSFLNPPPTTEKSSSENIVDSNSIIKIVSQFEHKGMKCYKILLNNGKQVNAHESDVKKNCVEILLKFYQEKIRTAENQSRANQSLARQR